MQNAEKECGMRDFDPMQNAEEECGMLGGEARGEMSGETREGRVLFASRIQTQLSRLIPLPAFLFCILHWAESRHSHLPSPEIRDS